MISIQASVSKGWLHKFGGFNFDESYYMDPMYRFKIDQKINSFLKERFPEYPIYNMEDNLVQAEFVKENQILVGGLQPNLLLGVILGSHFVFYNDKDSDISSKPLENVKNISELPPVISLISSPIIKKFTEQIIELKSKYPQYEIIPPFFWDSSGRATIHGIITTSHKLIGEEIFMLMVLDPDYVHFIHKWITDAYIVLINHFAKISGLNVTSIHIGECSSTMLSPEYWDTFVLPYINILGEEYRKIRLHSCGKSDFLINSFMKVTRLYSIDVGSGTSIKTIRSNFSNGISTFPSPELLVKNDKKRVLSWVDEIITENNIGDLRISYHVEPDYILDNCLAINDYLKEEYNINQKRLY